MDPMGYIYIYGGFHKWEYPNTVAGIYNWKSYENGWFGEYHHFRKPMGTTWWCWAPRTAELFVGPQRFSRGGRPGFPSGDLGYSINWSVRELFHVFHSGIKYDFWCFPAKKKQLCIVGRGENPFKTANGKKWLSDIFGGVASQEVRRLCYSIREVLEMKGMHLGRSSKGHPDPRAPGFVGEWVARKLWDV